MNHNWRDSHMFHAGKSFLRALYFAVGTFLFLFVGYHIGGSLYTSFLTAQSINALQSGISSDISHLKTQGDELAKDEYLIDRLKAGDSSSLIDFTSKEIKERAIGLMGVANSEGVIISRTMSKSNLGQNVFLTIPTGRVVAQGKSVESIELTSFGNQLFITTARPIFYEENMIGALFANYLTDDIYALRFKEKYLNKDTELVFYTKEFGVYGSSFTNPEIRDVINSYFNSGSDWVKNGVSGKTISLENGKFYQVEGVVFPGLEQSPGGVFIFIPRKDISGLVNIAIALIATLVFIWVALRLHQSSKGDEKGWRYRVIFIAVAVPIFIFATTALHFQNAGYTRLSKIPYPLYNSIVRLQPDFGIYDLNFEQNFALMVDTGDEEINAIHAELIFDPEMVEVKSFEAEETTCSYVIEKIIDNEKGRILIACVLLGQQEKRGSLRVANLIVVPKRTGTFTLSFDSSETKILANDGIGTNVLRIAQSGSYNVGEFDTTLSKEARQFTVFSPSHPNQSRWYNKKDARFIWRGVPGSVYKYEFDIFLNTIPSNTHTTQDTSVTIPISGDGVYYFHITLVSGGAVAHYRIQSDRTPPSITNIYASSEKIVKGDVVRLLFEAVDTASGIQRNYYADLGNRLFLPTGPSIFVPLLEEGEQRITLRVYDGADNYTEGLKIIHVEDNK